MKNRKNASAVSGSFRDPSGFVFWQDASLYRQINAVYREHYDHLMHSGLYKALVESGHLVPHIEVPFPDAKPESAYKLIKPDLVPFISYPYEWSFSQLKDAALLTLGIQQQAMEFGMSLKDASAYNVQFMAGRPVFIDTLSFSKYREGTPWIGYRQFCQHFLAPLALMSRRDIRLGQLLREYLDGIPLDLASGLLGRKTWLSPTLLLHIHLHARSQARYATRQTERTEHRVSRLGLKGIIGSLESAIRKLVWKPGRSEWGRYYEETNYSDSAFQHKRAIIAQLLQSAGPSTVWDLGSNTGVFSRIISQQGIPVVSIDADPVAVEKNYLECRERGDRTVLPLVNDLTNPSPGTGWQNSERMSLIQRGPADLVLALALVHHLAISNNLPFHRIADFFAEIGRALIVEFVPKADSQVQRLLSTKEDIFSGYTQQDFEHEFSKRFQIEASQPIMDSERVLYLMRRRDS